MDVTIELMLVVAEEMCHPIPKVVLLLCLLREHELKGILFTQSTILDQFLIGLPSGNIGVESLLLPVQVGLEVDILLLCLVGSAVELGDAAIVGQLHLVKFLQMGSEDLGTGIQIFSHEVEEVIYVDQYITVLVHLLFWTFIGQFTICFM